MDEVEKKETVTYSVLFYSESWVIQNVSDFIQKVTASNLGRYVDFLRVYMVLAITFRKMQG